MPYFSEADIEPVFTKYRKMSDKKRLLLISPFFYPEPISTGKYNTALAELLRKQLESIDVIASFPIYPEWKPEFTDKGLHGISIHRGGGFIKYPQKPVLRRMLLELWFTVYVLFKYFALNMNRKIDIVLIVFPPSLFFAVLSFFIAKEIKVVGIVHDLQGVYSERSRNLAANVLTKCITYVESIAFRKCNSLIFLSKAMASRALSTYRLCDEKDKISVQYPFVSIDRQNTQYQNISELELREVFLENNKHIVYSGALGEKQNPHALISFFEAVVVSKNNTICHVFSRGPLFNALKADLKPELSERILFHDLVMEESIPLLYELSDVQIIPQAPKTFEGSLPSKLPNLISCGVPIFAICDRESELSEIVNASGIGYTAHTWDPNILVDNILEFLAILDSTNRHDRLAYAQLYLDKKFCASGLIDLIVS